MNALLDHDLIRPLWGTMPHLPELLQAWSGRTLGRIAASLRAPTASPPVSAALRTAARNMIAPILGQDAAQRLGSRLAANPAVLSANYHGIECFPEMVQAVHFFALTDLLGEDPAPVVPVLSCANVSLQSQTYPRGLLLNRPIQDAGPIRLPLFPSAMQDVMAGQAPALTKASVDRMRSQWRAKTGLRPFELRALDVLLEEHILRPEVLGQPNFSAQVCRVNASLCERRYRDMSACVVYLELETLVRTLLVDDLTRPTGIMYQVLFDPPIRENILHTLAGERGCWQAEAVNGPELKRTDNAGTVFFWMTDRRGRRCPLRLCTHKAETCLAFQDTYIPLRPEAVIQGLAEGILIPSLFTAYTNLSLEHGLCCFGGIFLTKYLPAMLHATTAALDMPYVPHAPLAALPLSVQLRDERDLFPAGGVELSAAGGLTREDLTRVAHLTIEDVLPLSLASWSRDYILKGTPPDAWRTQVAALAGQWQGVELALTDCCGIEQALTP
jgi:hypothetical protein